MKRSTRSRSLSRHFWQACCLFGFGALSTLGAAGCGEPTNDDLDPDVTCTAEAVMAVNPATGDCEWVNACGNDWQLCADGFECSELPTDVCGIDARCEVQNTMVCNDCAGGDGLIPPGEAGDIACGCYDVSMCVEKDPITPPPTACENLAEAACVQADGCVAKFGWIDGGPTEPVPGDGACAGDNCGEPARMPPSDPTWGYLGCFPEAPDSCEGLDEMTCHARTDCQPIYEEGPDCFCAAPAPGDEPTDLPCVCPDPAGGYAGCAPVDQPPPPDSCWDAWNEGQCWSMPGCEWIYDMPMPDGDGADPCICPDDDPNCGCTTPGMEAPSYGWCQPQPAGCYDAYDQYTCEDRGCEWVPTDVWPDPAPCDCAIDDPSCGCAGAPVAPPDGYCEEPQPQGCWSYTDGMSCESDPSCDWELIEEDLCPPCAPDQPECECFREVREVCVEAGPQPHTCELLGDPGTCDAAPGCRWYELDGSEDRIACFDPAIGPDGACYNGDGTVAPPECCDMGQIPEPWPVDGYCGPDTMPRSCYDHGDMNSCLANPECDWGYPTGMDGTDGLIDICSGAHYDASGQCVNQWGDYVPDCCDPSKPAPPPECFDSTFDPATNTCVNADGTYAPDYCCANEPPPPVCDGSQRDANGVCYNVDGTVAPDECCDPSDPPVCVDGGGWRDQFGNCRGPADEVLPEECCWDQPGPICFPRQTMPGTCEQHGDEFSCTSAGCNWGQIDCDCDPADPTCECPDGYCY